MFNKIRIVLFVNLFENYYIILLISSNINFLKNNNYVQIYSTIYFIKF